MKGEKSQDTGSKRPNILDVVGTTPARNYLSQLQQLQDPEVEGLARQVKELLNDDKCKAGVERDVLVLKERAVQRGYINKKNYALTMWTKIHVGSFYLPSIGIPHYLDFAKRGLDEIVRGYKPK